MKLTHLISAGLLAAAGNTAFALDFVRQTQVIDGNSVVTDQIVTSMEGQKVAGTVTSAAMTSDLSIFQLWASYTDTNSMMSMLKLDEKSIGTFLPKVSITTVSEDPHVPTRTRADRPYSMTVSVSGMLSGASVPDYSQRIQFGRGFKEYSPVTFAPTGVTGVYPDSTVYFANGTYTIIPRPARRPRRRGRRGAGRPGQCPPQRLGRTGHRRHGGRPHAECPLRRDQPHPGP